MIVYIYQDLHNLYDGNQNAMKVANHELNGLNELLAFRLFSGCKEASILCFPLMTVITYKGFRMIAISVLPIDNKSLIYGSADAGRSCFKEIDEVNQIMGLAGTYINLSEHKISALDISLSLPADIEVHKGRDQRYYVLDTGL